MDILKEDRTPPSKNPFYIPSLDGIRAIAFLLVFVAHAGLERLVPGGLGVTIFFFLSGYLVTTLLRREWRQSGRILVGQFWMRRSLRIMPPMFLTIAAIWLGTRLGFLLVPGRLSAYVAAVFCVFDYYTMWPHRGILPGPGLGVLWSLSIEEHFYLIFPFLAGYFLRRKIPVSMQVRVLLMCCLFALLWRTVMVFGFHVQIAHDPKWTYTTTDCRFDSILWGCILAIRDNPVLSERKESWLATHKKLLSILGCAALLASLLYRNLEFRETLRYTIQSVALYPIFYYCLTEQQSPLIRFLNWKPVRQIGLISYSLYLCHLAILVKMRLVLPHHLVIAALIALVLSIGYAWSMRLIVERPLRVFRDSLGGRNKISAVADATQSV